jgi:hypothetical protein
MNKEIKSFTKILERLGKKTVEIYEEMEENRKRMGQAVFLSMAGVGDAPELHIEDGGLHMYKFEVLDFNIDKGRMYVPKDNEIWDRIKAHKDYSALEKRIRKVRLGSSHEILIREFVHDVIFNLMIRGGEISKSKSKRKIARRAKLLAEDLLLSTHHHGLMAPVFAIEVDRDTIQIGDYAVIRRARYSEMIEYSLGFANQTGSTKFTHVLEIQPKSLTTGNFIHTIRPNVRLLTSLVLALRLVFGGGVGTEFAHYWIMPNMADKRIGQVHQLAESEIEPSRAFRPGRTPSHIKQSQMKYVTNLVGLLLPIMMSEPNNIVRALMRYGQAIETNDIVDRIIDSMIAIECLFGGYSKKAARMAALMLSNGTNPEPAFEELLGHCYEARNKLVHGSSIQSAEKAAGGNLDKKSAQLTELVRRCLILSLSYSKDMWDNLKELADKEIASETS